MHPYIHCSVIYNSQDLQAAQVSISRLVDKNAVLHLHNGILLCRKKERNLTFFNSTDGLKSIMLCEISPPEKDKYHMISLYMESDEQNKLTNKIEIDS